MKTTTRTNRPKRTGVPAQSTEHFVKSIGAAGAVGVGLSAGGTARARSVTPEEHRELTAEFDDGVAIKQAFEVHAEDLVATLAEEGYLDDTDVSVLSDAVDGDEPTRVTVVEEDGEPTPHLQTDLGVAGGTLTAAVHPETGRSYAFHRTKDETPTIITDAGVVPQACYVEKQNCASGTCDGENGDGGGGVDRIGVVQKRYCCEYRGCFWSNTGNCCRLYGP